MIYAPVQLEKTLVWDFFFQGFIPVWSDGKDMVYRIRIVSFIILAGSKEGGFMTTKIRQVLSSSSIVGTNVQNSAREDLGEIKDLMIDLSGGRIAYAVLSFGGFLGMGDKLFAIPWEAFQVVQEEEVLILNVAKEKLEQAPGFDKDNWPDMADVTWGKSIHSYYGYDPYWD